MPDKNKKQPTAFRITADTSDKFKEIAQTLGTNQEQTLAKLIEVYEFEMGRCAIPEARENIDTFEGYMRAATSMYMTALETNQNMRALVRTEYESQLKSKDKTIEELQERTRIAEEVSNTASQKEEEYQGAIKELKKEISLKEKEIEKEKALAADRYDELETEYSVLKGAYTRLQAAEEDARSVLATYMKENEQLKFENNNVLAKNRELDIAVFNAERRNIDLTSKLERMEEVLLNEKENRKNEREQYRNSIKLEHRLALAELENELKKQHKAEMDELQKELAKYRDLYYNNINKD